MVGGAHKQRLGLYRQDEGKNVDCLANAEQSHFIERGSPK